MDYLRFVVQNVKNRYCFLIILVIHLRLYKQWIWNPVFSHKFHHKDIFYYGDWFGTWNPLPVALNKIRIFLLSPELDKVSCPLPYFCEPWIPEQIGVSFFEIRSRYKIYL